MIWHYSCPECGRPVEIDWDWLKHEIMCPGCRANHYPPTPGEDHFAYVGGDRWPKDMEAAVVSLRGTTCAAPGCFQKYTTLAHRRGPGRGGRTSVDNLIPLCAPHARAKGTRDYEDWAAELREAQPAATPLPEAPRVTPVSAWPQPAVEPGLGAARVVPVQMLASSAAVTPGRGEVVVRAPFLRAAAARLVLDYDWRAKAGTVCRVYLTAWPHQRPPKLEALGTPDYDGTSVVNDHSVQKDDSGSARLELALASEPAGRWVAAVFVRPGAGLEVTEFVLAGSE
jgi:hypothetical protein